ncbi:hypothetical protein JCM9279_006520 [Rhodotorula babjevae]
MAQHTPSTSHTAAPAPPHALDPSRPALLPRLIDDVLLAILEELAQLQYLACTYRVRQETLRSVCLASRRLCALARPILWRQVVIWKSSQITQLQAQSELGVNTTSCILFGGGRVGVEWTPAVLATAAVLPNLHELELSGGDEATLDLSTVAHFKYLRRLDLTNLPAIESDAQTLPALPHLEVLRLAECTTSPVTIRRWLAPAYLPQLRTIVVSLISFNIEHALSPDLLAQLEVIRIDVGAHVPVVAGLSPAVVVASPPHGPVLPRFSMYRTATGALKQPVLRRLMLHGLEQAIANNPPAGADGPPVVMIPIQVVGLEMAEASSAVPVPTAGTWAGLEPLCAQKGVCLEWYDEYELEESREIVPLNFRRYARELKASSRARSSSSI